MSEIVTALQDFRLWKPHPSPRKSMLMGTGTAFVCRQMNSTSFARSNWRLIALSIHQNSSTVTYFDCRPRHVGGRGPPPRIEHRTATASRKKDRYNRRSPLDSATSSVRSRERHVARMSELFIRFGSRLVKESLRARWLGDHGGRSDRWTTGALYPRRGSYESTGGTTRVIGPPFLMFDWPTIRCASNWNNPSRLPSEYRTHASSLALFTIQTRSKFIESEVTDRESRRKLFLNARFIENAEIILNRDLFLWFLLRFVAGHEDNIFNHSTAVPTCNSYNM